MEALIIKKKKKRNYPITLIMERITIYWLYLEDKYISRFSNFYTIYTMAFRIYYSRITKNNPKMVNSFAENKFLDNFFIQKDIHD